MEDRLEPLLTAHPWAQSPDQNVANLANLDNSCSTETASNRYHRRE
ncbi:hypothetical protein [Virgisporangium aurantiacum]|nr:hypothetical protein [Virgisporangium aurantiacum]